MTLSPCAFVPERAFQRLPFHLSGMMTIFFITFDGVKSSACPISRGARRRDGCRGNGGRATSDAARLPVPESTKSTYGPTWYLDPLLSSPHFSIDTISAFT